MYTPEKWQLNDQTKIFKLIEKYGFATIISPSLQSTHVPLILDRKNHRLLGHVASSNPHWREFQAPDIQHLVIFHGPHAYISPTWYQAVPNVPTWNYAAVHIKGKASLLSTKDTSNALDELMAKYEPSLLTSREVVTDEYQEKLAKGIVGFSITIEVIEAKAKLGQHRNTEQQLNVTQALEQSPFQDHQALLTLMKELKLGLG